jgi:hypothetical protein
MRRAVYDCFPYNGEIDVLRARLRELEGLVDWFVVIEADQTFSGMPRDLHFDPGDGRISTHTDRVRHLVVRDMPITTDPWIREAWQRDALVRAIGDATDDDLVLVSDADEIPRAESVAAIVSDFENPIFGFRQKMYYFYVNFRNVWGAEANHVWSIAAKRSVFRSVTPTQLRHRVRTGLQAARIVEGGGWHYSYLSMKDAAVREKIRTFAHQEFNNETFLSTIDVASTIARGSDLFGRPYRWAIDNSSDFPRWLTENLEERRRLSWPPQS